MSRFEHKRHRVEHEMKLALVELIRLFACGLVPETDAEMELMLQSVTDSADKRLNPPLPPLRSRIPDEQLRWRF